MVGLAQQNGLYFGCRLSISPAEGRVQVGSLQSGTLNLGTSTSQVSKVSSGALNLGTSKVSKASLGAYHDPRDTNQDGIVSAAEERAYELKHPERALEKALTSPATASTRKTSAAYTAQGTATTSQTGRGSMDLLA